MADTTLPFRILFPEHAGDYRTNLQFCCDHYRSVSEVCRRLKLNRQQFNRYLSGAAVPSRHNHKLISDFFGLELYELFTPHAEFASSFKRRTSMQAVPPVSRRWANLLQAITGERSDICSTYQGFYFKYFYTYLGDRQIKRELVHWYEQDGALVSSVKQRYLGEDETAEASLRFVTYRGIVGSLGDRLVNIDHHRGSGQEVSTMILYPKGRVLKHLNGMMVGVSHSPARSITAARVVMDFLGVEIDIRAALDKLGNLDPNDPTVSASIKQAIKNNVSTDETLFTPEHDNGFLARRRDKCPVRKAFSCAYRSAGHINCAPGYTRQEQAQRPALT